MVNIFGWHLNKEATKITSKQRQPVNKNHKIAFRTFDSTFET